MKDTVIFRFLSCFCYALALLFIIQMMLPLQIYAQDSSRAENMKPQEKNKELPNILDPPKEEKPKPVPYEQSQDDFPEWAYYTYRFLAVSVGGFPFSILLSSVIFDTYRTIDVAMQSDTFQSKYLPLFFGGAEKPIYTSDEVLSVLYIGVGVSLSIALVDLIISLVTYNAETAINELFEDIQ